jgi:hypothetical protein
MSLDTVTCECSECVCDYIAFVPDDENELAVCNECYQDVHRWAHDD